MSKEFNEPEDFEINEKGIPQPFILWLTKMYGSHPLLAPGLWERGELPWPTEFAIKWEKYKEQKLNETDTTNIPNS